MRSSCVWPRCPLLLSKPYEYRPYLADTKIPRPRCASTSPTSNCFVQQRIGVHRNCATQNGTYVIEISCSCTREGVLLLWFANDGVRKSLLLASSLCCLLLLSAQLGLGQNLSKAPKIPLDACSQLQASSVGYVGSPAAVSIERQLDVLSLGHDALFKGFKAVNEITATTPGNITSAMGSFIEGFGLAQNDYLCAAYLLGQSSTRNKDQQTNIDLEISVF